MAGLLAQVAGKELLASAWADVLASDSDDGVLGVGVTRFAEDAEERLAQLAVQVASGEYLPDRLVTST